MRRHQAPDGAWQQVVDAPGTYREFTVTVKLVERPGREADGLRDVPPTPTGEPARRENLLGLTVRDLDAAAFNRLRLPRETRGVLIARVDGRVAGADSSARSITSAAPNPCKYAASSSLPVLATTR